MQARLPMLWRSVRPRIVHATYFARLPWPVTRFYLRAWRLRARLGDDFSLGGATKPRELAPLLQAASGAKNAVEVGTGTGWTSIALAIADPERTVATFDLVDRPLRRRYLELIPPQTVRRITFHEGPGEQPPDGLEDVDFLFVDAAHDRDSTLAAFKAWRPRLTDGAVVAFHDYDDPQWPGVTEAIRELGLAGTAAHHLFVWRAAGDRTG